MIITAKSPFKVVQAMVNLQAEQNVEARLGVSFESFTLPNPDYDDGIEALTQMFDKMCAASPSTTKSLDTKLYEFIFKSDEESHDDVSELVEAVGFYNKVVQYLDPDDSVNMLKRYLYEYYHFESLDLNLLAYYTATY